VLQHEVGEDGRDEDGHEGAEVRRHTQHPQTPVPRQLGIPLHSSVTERCEGT
jgi:hypothetical protein